MPIIPLTPAQIKAGLTYNGLVFLNKNIGQFTYSIPTASSTWPGYDQLAPDDVTRTYPTVAGQYQILTAQQAANVRLAMVAWDELVDPDFTETADAGATYGEIRFAFADVPAGIAGVSNGGSLGTFGTPFADIWIDTDAATGAFDKGTYGYYTLLHEVGHSMGMKHSFSGTTVPAPYENRLYTVMSYTEGPASTIVTPGTGFDGNGNKTFFANYNAPVATTPLVLDILAIQSLYGAETTTRTGDDVYTFVQGAKTVSAIYDAAGNDTIDLSNFTRNSIVDLNPGAYSSLGLWYKEEQIAYWNAAIPEIDWKASFDNPIAANSLYIWENNLGIAFSTMIENAIGGSGRDTLIGNEVANRLEGGAGSDTLYGMSGDDQLFSGSGDDTLIGGDGDDGLFFGSHFGSLDVAHGEAGTDQIGLQGNYAGLTLDGSKIVDVESFALLSGDDTRFGDTANNFYDYSFGLTGSWGALTTFNGNSLRAGEDFTVNVSVTTAGAFAFFGGFGKETLTGGGQSDGFYFGEGRLNPGDGLNGGAGADDQIGLRGNYSIDFNAPGYTGFVSGIETIVLLSATDPRYEQFGTENDYNLTLASSMVGAGGLTVTGNGLAAPETMVINGSLVSGSLRLYGGAAADTLTGGGGADEFFGGLGGDSMVGNLGADKFIYTDVAQSVVGARDSIGLFNSSDLIDLAAIDANTLVDGNQDFRWIGSGAFSGGGTGAGELRYADLGSNNYAIQGDVDGNGTVDFEILLSNAAGYTPNAASFVGIGSAAPAGASALGDKEGFGQQLALHSREAYLPTDEGGAGPDGAMIGNAPAYALLVQAVPGASNEHLTLPAAVEIDYHIDGFDPAFAYSSGYLEMPADVLIV